MGPSSVAASLRLVIHESLTSQGAEFVYNHFLRGFLRMYEKKIDKVAEHGYGVMSQATEALGGSALLEKSNAAASGSGHDRA